MFDGLYTEVVVIPLNTSTTELYYLVYTPAGIGVVPYNVADTNPCRDTLASGIFQHTGKSLPVGMYVA